VSLMRGDYSVAAGGRSEGFEERLEAVNLCFVESL
jgi:hypothetical protein